MNRAITDRRIRVGLVGCGRISKNHFRAIETHASDLELVGVCDENPSVFESLSIDASVKRFTRMSDLLAEKPDLAIITTPSGLHPKQCIHAARAGIHVMTEKPMATRWNDGLRIVAKVWSHLRSS